MDYFKMMVEQVRAQATCNNGHVFEIPAIAKCPECGSRYVERIDNGRTVCNYSEAETRLMLENEGLRKSNNELRERVQALRRAIQPLHDYLREHGSAKDTLTMLQNSHIAIHGHSPTCRRGEILMDSFNPNGAVYVGCTCVHEAFQ